jgi:Uma2 family endonuclease
MSANPQPEMVTPEQYLEKDRAAQYRSEYYGGYMYAMSGSSWVHATIVHNLDRRLGNALDGRCSVRTTDVRVRLSPTVYVYPDVVIICGEPKFADGRKDIITNPTVIIEVLSPSTEAYDRGFKAAQYRTLESLREFAFVTQGDPRIEVFRRQSQHEWLMTDFIGLESAARFDSIDCAIPLAEIYDKVTFD